MNKDRVSGKSKSTNRKSRTNRRELLSGLAIFPLLPSLLAGGAKNANAQQTNSGFSFAVYGDSRSMMYLPYKSNQREEAIKLMVDIFALVLPEKRHGYRDQGKRDCALPTHRLVID